MKNKIIVRAGSKEYLLCVSNNDKSRAKGLSGVEKLPRNQGMIFVWKDLVTPRMIMKDMNFDLDFIFIGNNNKIIDIQSADKDFNGDIIPKGPIKAVIEINKGEGLNFKEGEQINISLPARIKAAKFGGSLTIEQEESLTTDTSNAAKIGDVVYQVKEKDVKLIPGTVQLLDENGYVLKNLKGKERIFSIPDTRKIYELSIKSKENDDFELFGEEILNILKAQEEADELFVKN